MAVPSTQRVLSQDIRDYLLSDAVFRQYAQAVSEFNLQGDEAEPQLSARVYGFISGQETADGFRRNLQMDFLLSSARVRELVAFLFLHVMAPVAKDIPELSEWMDAWKREEGVAGVPMSPRELVQLFLVPYAQEFTPVVFHRLEALLFAYVNGQRSREQTLAFFQRPPKLGGMEFTESQGEELLTAFDARRAAVSLQEETVVKAPEETTVVKAPEETKETQEEVTVGEHFTMEEEEPLEDGEDVEEEIARIAEAKKEVLSLKPSQSPEQMAEDICTDPLFVFSDPALQKRCRDIVEARARDVRDAHETRALLERSTEQGGLGVGGRRLSDMLERIERAVDAQEAAARAKIAREREAAARAKQEAGQARAQKREREEQAFVERFAKAAKAAGQSAKPQNAPPLAPKARPRVQDVSYTPRLAGPVEELGAMGLTEFRRLSKNPAQAAARVKDMVALQEEQGYARWVEILRALHSSPVMRAYRGATRDALALGASMETTLAKKRNGMTLDEYRALQRLNAELRF